MGALVILGMLLALLVSSTALAAPGSGKPKPAPTPATASCSGAVLTLTPGTYAWDKTHSVTIRVLTGSRPFGTNNCWFTIDMTLTGFALTDTVPENPMFFVGRAPGSANATSNVYPTPSKRLWDAFCRSAVQAKP